MIKHYRFGLCSGMPVSKIIEIIPNTLSSSNETNYSKLNDLFVIITIVVFVIGKVAHHLLIG